MGDFIMAFQPEDPDHKNHTIDLLDEILNELKKISFILGIVADIDTTEDEADLDEDI